jgi:3-methyladenine DNA glycosylase/8-oxoguanine DNA glycosylase
MNLQLPAHPPFSLTATARSHGWWQLLPFGWDACAEMLTRIERLSTGRVVEIRMREYGDGVSVEGVDGLSDAERQEVADRVAWMLQLDLDLGAFYALAQDEPRLAHAEETARGRILRSPTLFEDVVKTILTTNVQWSGTIRMVEMIVARFGDSLPAEPVGRAFPTPERLAATDEEALRAAWAIAHLMCWSWRGRSPQTSSTWRR